MDEATDFIKQVEDIKHGRIEDMYQAIIITDLVYLPDEPVSANELVDLNNAHRMQFGRYIQIISCEFFRLFRRFKPKVERESHGP